MAWNGQVRFSLPDEDVFAIGVDDLRVSASFSGVGTVLFGLAVQPGTGKVFATNTDANNLTRFEGHGEHASSTVIGHLHESRVTVIDPARAAVTPVHLNTHINYDHCCERVPGENERSLAFPVAGVFSAAGDRFYFAALGSDKIGVVSAAALASGFDQLEARARGELREIVLGDDVAQPSGPVGLALDARRDRLYVKTHFSNELVVIDTGRERIADRARLPSPEPAAITPEDRNVRRRVQPVLPPRVGPGPAQGRLLRTRQPLHRPAGARLRLLPRRRDGVTDTLQRFHGAGAFVRNSRNPGGLDVAQPDPATRAACVQRFRAATAGDVATAPPELRVLVGLCVASGPLPEVCFTDPEGAEPDEPERSRLRARDGDSLALGDLSRRDGPVTFTCYPPQAHQAEARRSAFSR